MEDQTEFVRWWDESVRPGGRPAKTSADQRWLSQEDAEALTSISHQQVSKWGQRLKDYERYRDLLYGHAYRKAMALKGQTDQRGASGTGENEWYTPARYIDMAREVLGGIDLDPASSDKVQERVTLQARLTTWPALPLDHLQDRAQAQGLGRCAPASPSWARRGLVGGS